MHASFGTSYWEQDAFLRSFDVLLVGSGIVGLSAAISLKERSPGIRVAIVDREIFPSGASTRNAGFACFGSISELIEDIVTEGEDKALGRMDQRKQGLEVLFSRVGREKIRYAPTGGYEVFMSPDGERLDRCLEQLDHLNRSLTGVFGGPPFMPYHGTAGMHDVQMVISHPYEGHLHPGLMISRLIDLAQHHDVEIIRGVEVREIEESNHDVTIIAASGLRLTARYLILATNGFTHTLLPGLQVMPARNQVYLTEPLGHLEIRGCYHHHAGYVYFRDVGDRLLIGGARHLDLEGEQTDRPGFTQQIREWLMTFTEQYVLGFVPQVTHQWSGIMGVGPEKHPVVRMTSDRVAAAVRLGGMGVAIGSLVGNDVASLIVKRL